jgi:hypothetical protein
MPDFYFTGNISGDSPLPLCLETPYPARLSQNSRVKILSQKDLEVKILKANDLREFPYGLSLPPPL